MRSFCGLLVAQLLVIGAPAGAESFDQLKGLSFDISFNQYVSALLPDGRTTEGNSRKVLRVYVSTQGNIFDYSDFGVPGNKIQEYYRITALDKAGEQNFGRMYTWTMQDGHLTRIHQLAEGLRIMTIAVEPVNLTCTFASRDDPDPKTGRIRLYRGSDQGPVYDLIARKITSSTCSVKKGNIFATDR